jgi:hypothetical protein
MEVAEWGLAWVQAAGASHAPIRTRTEECLCDVHALPSFKELKIAF